VVIPNSVTAIETLAFGYCTALTTLTIGSGVTTIERLAFSLCTGLTTIYNYAVTPQEIDATSFLGVNTAACTLYVPDESVDLYKAADVWKNFNIQPMSATGMSSLSPTSLQRARGVITGTRWMVASSTASPHSAAPNININKGRKYVVK